MNEEAAAIEQSLQEQLSASAPPPEEVDVENFHAIVDSIPEVAAGDMENVGIDALSENLAADGVVDAVVAASDRQPLDALISGSFGYIPYSYSAEEVSGGGNKIVEKLTSSLSGLADRQELLSEKINDDLFSVSNREKFVDGAPPMMRDRVELMWDMQLTQMEVHRWSMEVHLITSSVSSSASGVQTLFRSSG